MGNVISGEHCLNCHLCGCGILQLGSKIGEVASKSGNLRCHLICTVPFSDSLIAFPVAIFSLAYNVSLKICDAIKEGLDLAVLIERSVVRTVGRRAFDRAFDRLHIIRHHYQCLTIVRSHSTPHAPA